MILQIIIIGILIIGVVQLCNINTKKGFNNLNVLREISTKMVPIGEKFSLTLKVENNKRMPIMFMIVKQKIPNELFFIDEGKYNYSGNDNWHVSRYAVGKYQRKSRSYTLIGEKRGTYILREINVSIGDPLGLSIESKESENWLEVLICPKIKSISSLKFENTSFLGENTIRRWIHKDPLYIRGIREYNVEDRMKDISWKASLKANRLMVKEYDYTSDEKMVLIINVQCGDPYWGYLKSDIIDKSIDIALALASKALKENIPTGIWSNANLIYCTDAGTLELLPSTGSLESIIEYCTRMYKVPRQEFSNYLKHRFPYLNQDTTYVIIAYYINENDRNVIREIIRRGYKLKIVDISEMDNIRPIKGVEKICYKGEIK